MANPSPLTHTTPLARLTVVKVFDFVMATVGRTTGDLTATERAVLVEMLNQEQEDWRGFVAGKYGFAKFEKDYEWAGGGGDDPASGDPQVQLPTDYGELSDGFVHSLDTNGKLADKIAVVDDSDFRNTHIAGDTPYDNSDLPVAILLGSSTARRQIMEVFPAPDDGFKMRVAYHALCETLTNNADVLEAAVQVCDGIKSGTAARWHEVYGSENSGARHQRRRDAKIAEMTGNPKRSEHKKPLRATFFGERTQGGYAAFRPDLPA